MNDATERKEEAQTWRFRRYPEYKGSGIEWLGEIPMHWEVRRLRLTVTECQNGVWGEEADGMHDLICVRVADFDRTQFRASLDEPTMRSIDPKIAETRRLKEEDLLLEKSGGGDKQPVGAVVTYDHGEPAVCSNFVARMTVAGGYDPRYLTYVHAALYSARINVRSIKQSTGIQNLDSSSYLNEHVGFPKGSEQRAIAAFLDRETAKIDGLVAKKERLIELLQEKRAALITRAVTRGLDREVPMKDSGVEWLREIPAHWEVKRLHHLLDLGKPLSYGILLPGPRLEDGVPYIGAGDVSLSKLRLEELPRTTPEIAAAYPRTRMQPGELVYAIRGSFGNVEVIPKELAGVNLSRDAARIGPDNRTNSSWLKFALRSGFSLFQFGVTEIGATITGVNIRDLKRTLLTVPPNREQRAIAAFLDRETATIDALIAKIRQAIDHLKEFRSALISAAVTGKIDVREAAS